MNWLELASAESDLQNRKNDLVTKPFTSTIRLPKAGAITQALFSKTFHEHLAFPLKRIVPLEGVKIISQDLSVGSFSAVYQHVITPQENTTVLSVGIDITVKNRNIPAYKAAIEQVSVDLAAHSKDGALL